MHIKDIQSLPLPERMPNQKLVGDFWSERLPLMLDLGTGDVLMGSAILRFFPVGRVWGVDAIDRMRPSATSDFSLIKQDCAPFLKPWL